MVTLRIRSVMWFAAGLAIALTLVVSFTAWRASAIGANESTFVPVTPVRILDTSRSQQRGTVRTVRVRRVARSAGDGQRSRRPPAISSSYPSDSDWRRAQRHCRFPDRQRVRSASARPTPLARRRRRASTSSPATSCPNCRDGEPADGGADAGKIEITFDAYGTPGPTDRRPDRRRRLQHERRLAGSRQTRLATLEAAAPIETVLRLRQPRTPRHRHGRPRTS